MWQWQRWWWQSFGQRTEDIGLNGRDINNKEEEEEGRLEGRQCKNICRVYNPKNTGMKVIEQGRFIDGMRELGP